MTPTRRLYGVLATHDLTGLAVGQPQVWISQEGDAVAIAGRHLAFGFCWCQPAVRPTLSGWWIRHRAAADLT